MLILSLDQNPDIGALVEENWADQDVEMERAEEQILVI